MLIRFVGELGSWNWMVFGVALLAIEILAPGFFLVWIGLAAIITGALTLFLQNAGFWIWELQVVVFLILSLALAYGGARLMRATDDSDEPLLNRRGDQLIGRTAMLDQPIAEGRGRIRIDDTVWRVKGPELAAGVRVRIISAHGGELVVQAV